MLMFKLRVGDIGGEREGGEISSYVKGHRSLPEHCPKTIRMMKITRIMKKNTKVLCIYPGMIGMVELAGVGPG